MRLEPDAGVDSDESGGGSEMIRPKQVPTGSFGVDVKLVRDAEPGPEIAGGNGHGTDGVDDDGEDVSRMGLDGPGLYSSDGCVLGIAAANRGEAEALLEGSGLSVRDRDEMSDFLKEHYGRGSTNGRGAGRYGVDEEEKEKAAARERVIWDRMIGRRDLMGDIGVLSFWDDAADARANEEDDLRAASMEEEALGDDDEVDDDDEDAISAEHDTDPSLEDELGLWAGPEDEEPDDLADAFGRQVERVLAYARWHKA